LFATRSRLSSPARRAFHASSVFAVTGAWAEIECGGAVVLEHRVSYLLDGAAVRVAYRSAQPARPRRRQDVNF